MHKKVCHAFSPVYNKSSKILILGTMTSPASAANGFYYSHPQNRFWRILAVLLKAPLPQTPAQKERFLLNHNIALWDVLKECSIIGASDSSIKNPVVNDLNLILTASPVKAVFATGKKAGALYNKYCFPFTNIPIITLPSTSPANCKYGFGQMLEEYGVILKYLKGFSPEKANNT